MTPRETAYRLLYRIEKENAYSDRVLAGNEMSGLERRDRLFVRELVQGAIRWQMRLDHIIDTYYNKRSAELETDLRLILRMGLYQALFMDAVPDWAAVNETVSLAVDMRGKKAAGLVNAIMRRFQREGEPAVGEGDAERISVSLSHPEWLIGRWVDAFGTEDAEKIARAGIEKHPVFVTSTGQDEDSDALTAFLNEHGFTAKPVEGMPGYCALERADGFFESEAFRSGNIFVQDPASGMAALLLDPQPGERVLDLCAAPGGKTLSITGKMSDSGTVTALDRNESRLRLVRRAADRAGFVSVETVAGDATDYGERDGLIFDRVLVDVPCSGTAVLSKRPEMKWRLKPDDPERLSAIQTQILDNAARRVKKGGVLVYSTCTLEHEENVDNIKSFLDRTTGFELDWDSRMERFRTEYGHLILPHQMEGTGAFAARIRRI